ncbi:hypothetical protein HUZ36_07720 [Pseudoalteromonas sp. McH1-7]|uniref:CatB-related O-acetyltransferase n=1 Tax=Pseudoalteromonas sp. McH1-7 TaxID=2745574 RepID=UPI0015910495|nr:DapH/DapD/GlmU-related protein [Pseudoalteromonas sp. McH1-7]NUZ10663.1 hypothetical protein [Pseudoalteromonas sp. McH1-7]
MCSIINSKTGENFKGYNGSILKNSTVGDSCVIGEFSRVYNACFQDWIRIDRNNFILETQIGKYSYTGQFSVIMHSIIGKFCSISWGVTIGAGEHDYNKLTTHDFLYNSDYDLNPNLIAYDRFIKPLSIGNDVWIGANVTVVRGVKIGNGAVIGANSIVTKDVPAYAVVAGCPAKVIKYRFTDEIIKRLEMVAWWDLPSDVIKEKFKAFSSADIEAALNEIEGWNR